VAIDQTDVLRPPAKVFLYHHDRVVDLPVVDELAVEEAELEHHEVGNPRHGLVGAVEHQPEAEVALQKLLGDPDRTQVQLVEDICCML
jgi:hypothetical protein